LFAFIIKCAMIFILIKMRTIRNIILRLKNMRRKMSINKTPITILNGYLGSGKTTLLNHLLNNQDGYKVAIIVNDLGEVNIDARLIEKGTEVSMMEEQMIELSNGC